MKLWDILVLSIINLNIANNWEKERNKQIERVSADGVRSSFKPQ